MFWRCGSCCWIVGCAGWSTENEPYEVLVIGMKERPILFSAEMVRAILDGRKSQTRRVVKPQPVVDPEWEGGAYADVGATPSGAGRQLVAASQLHVACPYGVPGDRLWIKEAFYREDYLQHGQQYHAVLWKASTPEGAEVIGGGPIKWRHGRYMPKDAARLLRLEITAVRVQRVQEIAIEDAQAEGFEYECGYYCDERVGHVDDTPPDALFARYWDSLNAKRGYGWDVNPWVWVLEFKRVS